MSDGSLEALFAQLKVGGPVPVLATSNTDPRLILRTRPSVNENLQAPAGPGLQQINSQFMVSKPQIRSSTLADSLPESLIPPFVRVHPDIAASECISVKQSVVAVKKRELTPTQTKVFNLVVNERKSVFYTGGAGTGKSMLLAQIISNLRSCSSKFEVVVTAPTGIAAVNISGCTIHAFAGVGLLDGSVDTIIKNIMRSQKVHDRWRAVRVLVIDEISMVDGDLFDKLENVARLVRHSNLPFGGIQLIVTGDFFQLPPVSKNKTCKFAFEAQSWSKCFHSMIQLSEIFRQKDQKLINILNELRLGRASQATRDILYSLCRPLPGSGLLPTELFAIREQVDKANTIRLNTLPGTLSIYSAQDFGIDQTQLKKLTDSCLAPQRLQLKIGAQVMLLRNISEKNEAGDVITELVNGTMGITIECVSDYVVVDFYLGGTANAITPSQQQLRRRKIFREEWKIQDAYGNILSSRFQIPLMLSYAISIHKSQGQTLELLKVDLGRVFEKGQSYVALSRATKLEGIQVLNFEPQKVMADTRVLEFYRKFDNE